MEKKFSWRSLYSKKNQLTEEEQILNPLPPNPIAQDFFKHYIGEEIVDHIVTQTNLYAETYKLKGKKIILDLIHW